MKNKNLFVAILLAFTFLISGLIGASSIAFAEEAVSYNCKAALLMDADTGKTVFQKNQTERLQIASMVKIITLNLIFEEIESGNINYDTEVIA